jgi:hypothetical protein
VTIRDGVDQAVQLTRQLIAFCARQILTPTLVDLNATLLRLLPRLKGLLGPGVEVGTDLQPNLGRVSADAGQLEQVIQILAANARDAMPRGGKLTWKTRNLEPAAPAIQSPGEAGSWVALSVTDSGCGMDEKLLDRIYEPFFTTKDQPQSSGMGLATAYGIIKQMEGRLEVVSELGRGTTFTIYLPRSLETVADFEIAPTLADTKRTRETVLVVDDDDIARSLTRRILRSEGYIVLEARYGGEALLTCLKHPGAIHLLIADAVMPQLSGPGLAEQASSLRSEMKSLLLASNPTETGDANWSYLAKPFTPETLLRKVREMLLAMPTGNVSTLG